MPRDFSSGAWSRKPQRGPEANFVEPIEDCKHNRKRQNSRDYESAIESAFIDFPHVGHGETWPQNYKENAECKTLAMAVLSSLEKWVTKSFRFCRTKKQSQQDEKARAPFSDRSGQAKGNARHSDWGW